MNERLKFEGKRGLLREEALRHERRLDGLVRSLRDLLDPTEHVAELDAEQIRAQAFDLAVVQGELKGVLEEIAKIDRILDRGV